jgi:hypothetical protein
MSVHGFEGVLCATRGRVLIVTSLGIEGDYSDGDWRLPLTHR